MASTKSHSVERSPSQKRRSRSHSGSKAHQASRSPKRRKTSPSPRRGEPATVYVAGFPPKTDARDIVDFFEKVAKVERIHMKERFAFITMSSGSAVDDAIYELNGAKFQGRSLRVEIVKGRGAPDKRDNNIAPSDTLFVVNFNPDRTDEKDIEDFFGKLRPKHVEIFPKWAFVTMYSVDDAKEAVKTLDGTWLRDRQITVTFKDREATSSRPIRRPRSRSPPPRPRSRSPPPCHRSRSPRPRSRSPRRSGGSSAAHFMPPPFFVPPIPPFFPPFFPQMGYGDRGNRGRERDRSRDRDRDRDRDNHRDRDRDKDRGASRDREKDWGSRSPRRNASSSSRRRSRSR
eukprot:GGOE01036296.1.p1 GENE.GGOE01036296.1~~GGOE01036296.1.p1  ORF type:complete len:353 (-),score=14.52 GGOE01036296.1:350-1381(-)